MCILIDNVNNIPGLINLSFLHGHKFNLMLNDKQKTDNYYIDPLDI